MQNRSRKWHCFWVCWGFFWLFVCCCYYCCFMVCLENPSLLSAAPHCPVQEWDPGTDPTCSTASVMLSEEHFHEKLSPFPQRAHSRVCKRFLSIKCCMTLHSHCHCYYPMLLACTYSPPNLTYSIKLTFPRNVNTTHNAKIAIQRSVSKHCKHAVPT